MPAIIVPDNRLETFYKHNPAFEILQANLTSQTELAGLNWQDVEQAPTLDVLKQYQRLLRLYPDPAVAQALLGQTAAQQALQAPHPGSLHSAQAIAAIPQEQFIQKYSALVEDPAIARQIHQNATTVAAKTQLLWANVQNLVASPHFRAMRVNNLGEDVYQFEDFPDYQELFGSLDYCECDECQSIFGPAAYFVDLMRIIDRYITTPNSQSIGNLSLDTRRPDLALIQLTCANTNDLLLYLDIVNTVLETQVVQISGQKLEPGASQAEISEAAYNDLATAIYPFNLPFHLPLEQIRRYLGQLNIDLATLYKTFNLTPGMVDRETLKLSAEEYTLITTAKPDPTFLASAYGINNPNALLTQLSQETIFLQQTGLSRQDLTDLFTQNLSAQELQVNMNPNIAHGFYINQALDQPLFLPLTEDTIPHLNPATLDSTLDRLHRFIRLARKLNWTFADLDWALHSLSHSEIDAAAIGDIAKIKRLQTILPLPLDVLCSFWFDIKTIGVGTSSSSQALFDRIFNNPRMLGTQAPYHPLYQDQKGQTLNPLYTDPLSPPPATSRIAASLGLKLDDFTALVAAFPEAGASFTVQNLSVLYRHTQLAARLKLPMQQYLLLLQLMLLQSTKKSLSVFTPDDLFSLLETANWLNTTGFNVYELDYIVWGTPSKYVAARYRDEDLQPFLQKLAASSLKPQPELVASDILDWDTLVTGLNNHSLPGPGQRIWSLLPQDGQNLLTQMAQIVNANKGSTPPNLKELTPVADLAKMLAALNLVLQHPDFYEKADFADLYPSLPDQVRDLLSSKEILSANEHQKLNQLLLMSAFPLTIAPIATQQLDDEWKEKLIQQLAAFVNSTTDKVEALMNIIAPVLLPSLPPGILPPGIQNYIEVFSIQPGQQTYTDQQMTYIAQALANLSRALVLVDKMQLTSAEITSIGQVPDCYNFTKDTHSALSNLQHLSIFKKLTAAFQDTQNLLVGYFAQVASPSDPLAASLADITGWDKTQIEAMIASYFPNESDLLTTVKGIARLKKAFDLNATLGANVDLQKQILPSQTALPTETVSYTDPASAIIGLVKARYSDDAWPQISANIMGALDEARRSALSGYVLWRLNLKNLRELSEYLLIDVEMSGCSSISKIKQGILSLQMYLQRCRMSLETGVLSMQDIDEAWWEWMMSYRIWQANRKVFLYPENHLDPTLRKNSSDLFQELSAELLQSDITSDAVEAAYQHYFDKLADLAKLRIAESYRCSVQQPGIAQPVDTLFLFGRTATEPTTYYYRTCLNPTSDDKTWTPWSKMDVRIQSDYLSPVFAFGKLFVFWVETQSQTTQASSTDPKVTAYKATIKYTFQTLSGQWVQPQTLEKDIIIGIDPETYQPSGVDLNTANLVWKKIYALDLPAHASETENLLLLFGSMFPFPQQPPEDLPKDDTNTFDRQVYQTLLQSSTAPESWPQGYSSLFPVTTLSSNLLTESTRVILPFQAWHTTATLSQPRCWLAATTVGSLALFAGGFSTGQASASNLVDIYDAHTGKWSIDPHGLSQARSSLAAATVGSLALFAGGTTAGGAPSNVVDIYNASATTPNKWTQATLPSARANIAATSVGSLALFAGGDIAGASVSADLNIYDTQDQTWKTLTLSKPRTEIAATTVGSLAIFVGGRDESGTCSTVDIYDASNDQLRSFPVGIPDALSAQAATTVGTLALFAGGFTGNWATGIHPENPTTTANIYQAGTQQWTQANLKVARNWLTATSTGSQAFFAGGLLGDISNNPGVSDVCDVFDVFSQQWSTLQLSQARCGLTATSVGSLVLFAGGSTQGYYTPTAMVDIFDTRSVIYDNYLSDAISTDQSEVSYLAEQLGLSRIKQHASIFTVKNQPGWFTFDNGNEAFLAVTEHSLAPISESLALTDLPGSSLIVAYNSATQADPGQTVFTRLTTSVVEQLSQRAFMGGIDQLLTLDSQSLPELDFARLQPLPIVNPPASHQLDFQGAYGTYFQEIFFHIPFLIANTLQTDQRFADAQRWYQYIFNPTQPARLMGYWPLNGTVHDLAGNHNVSIASGNWQTVSDFPGSASRSVLTFPKGGYFYLSTESLLAGSEMTVSFWAFGGNSSSPEQASAIPADDTEQNTFDIRTPTPDGTISFTCGKDEINYTMNPQIYQGVWSHWVFTKNIVSGVMSIYLNGKLLSSEMNKTSALSGSSGIVVVHDGNIAELRIWSVALSPDKIVASMNEQPADRFWRYLPLQGGTFETLQQLLTDDRAIKSYNDDPFDPDAIAQVRFGTYQKTLVMKYIDNLLDWGDSLFAQDTWESITQATMLYFLAYDLLGPKPEDLGPCPVPAPQTFTDIKTHYGMGNIPQFLLELEQRVSANGSSSTVGTLPFNELNAYFGVSENDQFIAYWDRVEDRLYKIRHCQNIEGVVQQLALFEPALNPMDLVRAVAAGNAPLATTSGLSMDVPHYRFDALLERAKNIISTVIQLGEALLSALEKKDAEQLSLLRASQEATILQLIQTTREKQISEAQATLASLNQSLTAATNRVNHYQGLLNGGLSANEQSSLLMMGNALPFQTAATGLNTAATVLFLLPTIFGLADGGMDFGQAVTTAASASDGIAAMLNQQGSLAAAIAQFARRTEDWQMELQMAQDDVTLITQQIVGAGIVVDIATTELTSQQKSLEQANEIEDFLQRKFSNQDLYQWMVNRLSDFYFQTFKLALALALEVQKAYQYELNSDETYITFNYWDNLKQGLLAGEGLLFGLNQLEKAYLDEHIRSLEIEKTISLLQLDPVAFLQLRNTGKCQFQLHEQLFDYDFPGHYRRQIKTLALSIPAIVGPYQNINATLTQVSDQVLVQPDPNGVNYLLGVQGATRPDSSVLRSSWRRNQKIALSRGINDSGMFELNFRDERYLPFEGTGAVSSWELSMPRATNRIDFSRLSDVIIHLSYTALDAGPGPLASAVQDALKSSTGAYYMNIKQTFPGAWYTLLSVQTDPTKQSLEFSLSSGIIPPHLTNVTLKKVSFRMDVPQNIDLSTYGSFLTLTIGSTLSTFQPLPIAFALDKNNSADVPIQNFAPEQFASTWSIGVNLTRKPAAILKDGFLDPAVVRNMECILFYEGDIAWNE